MKRLPLYILIACVVGIVCGVILSTGPFREFAGRATFLDGVNFLGQAFLRLLKMVVVPLIFTSLISGMMSMGNIRRLGRMGWKTLLYFIATSGIAIAIGLVLVNVIQPGQGMPIGGHAPKSVEVPSISQILLEIIPQNPIGAFANGDMISVIFFSLLIGAVIISFQRHEVDRISGFIEEGFKIMMRMTHWVLATAPLGIWALVTYMFAEVGFSGLESVGWYFVTVIAGLTIQFAFTLPMIVKVFARRSPFEYIKAVSPALLTAFSTASSQATLPLSMECVEHGAGIDNEISSFVLPLGATINMNGTALYEAVAALFIAQAYAMHLSIHEQVMVFLTALLVSIGAAGIPHAGLVMMTVVLTSVGLPPEGIGMIVGVDRILDMMRTATNVWSDIVGAAVMHRLENTEP